MYCSLPGSSLHGISQARILSGLTFPLPGDLPDLTCTASRFFTTELPGKSKIKRLKEHKRANLRDSTGVQGSQCNSAFKESTCNARDPRFDSWVGKIPWRRKSTHSSILACNTLMDRRAWRAFAHGVEKRQTRLSD